MEKLIHDFLLAALFGSDYKKVDDCNLAINRAYRDFCRTIRKEPGGINARMNLKDSKTKATNIILEFLKKDKSNYDEWHEDLCKKLVDLRYTYGQAQKWVNMTMKYLYILGYKFNDKTIEKLHVPIDSKIIEKAQDIVRKDIMDKIASWSSIDNYKIYWKFQDNLRTNLKPDTPFFWELKVWNE